jgi:hypothetical protein
MRKGAIESMLQVAGFVSLDKPALSTHNRVLHILFRILLYQDQEKRYRYPFREKLEKPERV